MTYEPLHHKYRPQTFRDLVGQEAISTTLINALNREKIAPAYLFTGPRGTGKTSSARILAKSLNCLSTDKPTANPCGECEVCKAIARGSALDVIEIDAASNTGVDNIREIIERAQFAPVQCRYKVYVIDECHMLSTAAFNALLKTLEEPPKHVIFVLATTDPQRVLPTIISRCQRFDYRRIPLEAMVKHLRYIAEEENIEIAAEALTLVAQIANGGLRDAESLLDQLSLLTGEITSERVWELVGAVAEKDLFSLLQAINRNNSEKVIEQSRHLMNRGREPLVILQNLAGFYLNLLIAKTAPNRADLVAVTSPTWEALCEEAKNWQIENILKGQEHLKESEISIKNTTQPRLWLEVTLLGLLPSVLSRETIPTTSISTTSSTTKQNSLTPTSCQPVTSPPPQLPVSSSQEHISKSKTNSSESVKSESVQPTTNSTPTPLSDDLGEIWELLLENITQNSTQTLLKQHGHLIGFNGNSATIGYVAKGLSGIFSSKKKEIQAAFQSLYDRPINVIIELVSKSNSESKSNPPSSSNSAPKVSIPNPNYSNGHQPQNSALNTLENNSKNLNIDDPFIPHPNEQVITKPSEILLEKDIDYHHSEQELENIINNFITVFEGEIVTSRFDINNTSPENKLNNIEVSKQEEKPQEIKIESKSSTENQEPQADNQSPKFDKPPIIKRRYKPSQVDDDVF